MPWWNAKSRPIEIFNVIAPSSSRTGVEHAFFLLYYPGTICHMSILGLRQKRKKFVMMQPVRLKQEAISLVQIIVKPSGKKIF